MDKNRFEARLEQLSAQTAATNMYIAKSYELATLIIILFSLLHSNIISKFSLPTSSTAIFLPLPFGGTPTAHSSTDAVLLSLEVSLPLA